MVYNNVKHIIIFKFPLVPYPPYFPFSTKYESFNIHCMLSNYEIDNSEPPVQEFKKDWDRLLL